MPITNKFFKIKNLIMSGRWQVGRFEFIIFLKIKSYFGLKNLRGILVIQKNFCCEKIALKKRIIHSSTLIKNMYFFSLK